MVGSQDHRPKHYLLAHPPRIPIVCDIEVIYQDLDGWQIDYSQFIKVYVGPANLYIRYAGGPFFTLIGLFRIAQRFQASHIWYPPRQREFPDDASICSTSSQANIRGSSSPAVRNQCGSHGFIGAATARQTPISLMVWRSQCVGKRRVSVSFFFYILLYFERLGRVIVDGPSSAMLYVSLFLVFRVCTQMQCNGPTIKAFRTQMSDGRLYILCIYGCFMFVHDFMVLTF